MQAITQHCSRSQLPLAYVCMQLHNDCACTAWGTSGALWLLASHCVFAQGTVGQLSVWLFKYVCACRSFVWLSRLGCRWGSANSSHPLHVLQRQAVSLHLLMLLLDVGAY